MGKRANGEGSVYRTKEGRWRGTAVVNGRRRYVSGSTRRAASERLVELLRAEQVGAVVPTGRQSVDQWLNRWLADEVEGSVRPSTYADYESIVRCYLIPELGGIELRKLRPGDVSRLHKRLLARGLSSSRVLKAHRVLSRSLHIAERWGLTTRNVATLVSPPRAEEIAPRYLRPEQVQILLSHVADDAWRSRWHLALLGLRQGEVLGLRWQDLDLDAGRLTVSGALQRQKGKGLVLVPPKSRTSRRSITLPADVVAALRARRHQQAVHRLQAGTAWKDSEDLVFTSSLGSPVDPARDHRDWKALLTRAGLPVMRLHDARHTAATALLLSGVPLRAAMEWLGHSNINQTVRYTHVVPDLASVASEGIERQFFTA
jgi:integrase